MLTVFPMHKTQLSYKDDEVLYRLFLCPSPQGVERVMGLNGCII
jgi:hypothetical protein